MIEGEFNVGNRIFSSQCKSAWLLKYSFAACNWYTIFDEKGLNLEETRNVLKPDICVLIFFTNPAFDKCF